MGNSVAQWRAAIGCFRQPGGKAQAAQEEDEEEYPFSDDPIHKQVLWGVANMVCLLVIFGMLFHHGERNY